MIANDVFRGRLHRSFEKPVSLVPNAVTCFTIDLHTQSHRFQKGHRIAVTASLLLLLALAGCRVGGPPAFRRADVPVERRVADLLGRMTVEEKFWQLLMLSDDFSAGSAKYPHGVYGLQVRNLPKGGDSSDAARAIASRINAVQRYFVDSTRLGIPIIPFDEALHGLTQAGATSFPQAIGLAATWDTALMGAVSGAIAAEARRRGVRQVLSPVINLATDPRWGRTEETYGEDPYLAAAMGVSFIAPFERAGVITTPKHFVANVGDGGRDSYPIALGPRELLETHLVPFDAAVRRGHARSVMASYNSVDGVPATASPWLLTETLRNRWGFRGVVVADAGAVGGANVLHGTAPDYATAGAHALNAGLDVLFQTSPDHAALFWPAFESGAVPAATLDSAVARVLRLKFELGLFEHPYVDTTAAPSPARLADDRSLARRAAAASLVLLRNDGGTLPLSRSLRRIAVIGPDAVEARLGGYSGPGNHPVSILEGIRDALGGSAVVRYASGPGRVTHAFVTVPAAALPGGLHGSYFDNIELSGSPKVTRTDSLVDFHWTLAAADAALSPAWFSARWEGTLRSPVSGEVRLGVEADDGYRLTLDGRVLIDRWRKETERLESATVRLERGRRYQIRLEYYQNTGNSRVRLVWNAGAEADWHGPVAEAAALARASDVAVVVAGIEEGEFRDRASLRLPGHQEELIRAVAASGRPTVVVLVGGSAVTMNDWLDEVGAVLLAWYPGEEGGHAVADVLFGAANPAGRLPVSFPMTEGQLPWTYRHKPTGRGDDYADLTGRPRFPFGFGLSYTRFTYEGLELPSDDLTAGDSLRVRLVLRNSGSVAGDEVVQLYLRDEVAPVSQPVMRLAAFQRVSLAAGQKKEVVLTVPAGEFAILDSALRWVTPPGRFQVMVGASAADIRLRGTVTIR